MRRRLSSGTKFLIGLLPARADLDAARRAPFRDVIAGVTVAIVALPLALAFGVASGLGAEAGITTAIIAGALAAIFGGSNVQISGPTGAMTVVLIPVVASFGAAGVLQVGVMAGVILLVFSLSGIGRYVKYLPTSLVEGFTAGIAVVIALQQLPNILGVTPGSQEKVWAIGLDAVVRFFAHPEIIPVAISLGVTAMILLGSRWKPALPLSLFAVAIATVISHFGGFGLATVGSLPAGLPAPSATFLSFELIPALLPSALAVAALAALESLLSATVADAMSVGQRHNSDRELFGQGIANLVVPFFGGVPATAAIARTAVGIRAGAQSRVAALTHSVVLLLFILVAAPLVGAIPLVALGGVLLATTVQMIQVGAVKSILRSSRGEALVLIVTLGVTVAIDLVTAVIVGLIFAGILALRAVAKSAQIERVPLDESDHTDDELRLLDDRIVAFRLDGALFFGAAHRFLLELTEVTNVAVVILRMSRLSTVDATGARMLDDAIQRLERRGVVVLLSGIRPGHRKMFAAMTSVPRLTAAGRVFAETPEAIDQARSFARTGSGLS